MKIVIRWFAILFLGAIALLIAAPYRQSVKYAVLSRLLHDGDLQRERVVEFAMALRPAATPGAVDRLEFLETPGRYWIEARDTGLQPHHQARVVLRLRGHRFKGVSDWTIESIDGRPYRHPPEGLRAHIRTEPPSLADRLICRGPCILRGAGTPSLASLFSALRIDKYL